MFTRKSPRIVSKGRHINNNKIILLLRQVIIECETNMRMFSSDSQKYQKNKLLRELQFKSTMRHIVKSTLHHSHKVNI